MADEIKIHLTTFLKDHGIKATREQIDGLARDVKKMNRDMQKETNASVGSIGSMEGAFGKLQKAIGGFGGKAMAVIAAFKVGVDIGNWINDKVLYPLGLLKKPIEELKRQNKAIERAAQEALDNWRIAFTEMHRGWDEQVKGAEKTKQAIDDATQAYLKMQAARERAFTAGDTAETLSLKREKFDAMAKAESPEQSAEIGKKYDIMLAETQMRQELAKFDREAELSADKQLSAEKQLHEARAKRRTLTEQMISLTGRLRYAESQQSVQDLTMEGSIAMENETRAQYDRVRRELDAATREVEKRKADIAAAKEAAKSAPQERENLVARLQLEIDERKKALADYRAEVEKNDAERAEREQAEWDRMVEQENAQWQREQEQIRRNAELELRERQRVEDAIAAERISNLRNELSEQQRANAEARSWQNAAAGSLNQAWQWYRNQSQMQSVIDEQKAQAAAEAQWQKDFDRLKSFRKDWRTAEFGSLSAADEAVRQVALAKEEKNAADRAVIETAENTRGLAEKIDELLQAK